jgi:hypothetical protein
MLRPVLELEGELTRTPVLVIGGTEKAFTDPKRIKAERRAARNDFMVAGLALVDDLDKETNCDNKRQEMNSTNDLMMMIWTVVSDVHDPARKKCAPHFRLVIQSNKK